MAITSAPCTNTTFVHGEGDSISATNTGALGHWMFRPGSLRDQLQQAPVSFLPISTTGFQPVAVGQQGSPLLTRAQRGRRDNCTTYGVGGQTVTGAGGMATDVAVRFGQWPVAKTPGHITINEGGTNDFAAGGSVTYGPGGTFRTAYASWVSQQLAIQPGVFIICLSIPCRSEAVVGGHFVDGTDTWAGNTDIQAVVAANPINCLYADIINPALAYIVGGGLQRLTLDFIHPTDFYCASIIAPTVMSLLRFS